MRDLLEWLEHTFTGMAFTLTVSSGLLTIMGERFLYSRRGYPREAAITAFIGWFYVVGGALLYLGLQIVQTFL